MKKYNLLFVSIIIITFLVSGCTISSSLSTSIPSNFAMTIKEAPLTLKYNLTSNVAETFKLKGGYTVNSNQNEAFRKVFENYLQNKSSCLRECEPLNIDLVLTEVDVKTEDHTTAGNKAALILAGAGTTNTEYISSAKLSVSINYKGEIYNREITANANAQQIWSTYGTGYNYSHQVTKSNTTPQDAVKSTLDNVNLDIIIQIDKFMDSIIEQSE